MESEEGHQLETEIRRRQQEGGARIEGDSHRSGQQHRLDRDPRQACAPVEPGPQLHRNHRQQGSFVAVAPEHHQHQRGRGFNEQQREERPAKADRQRRGEHGEGGYPARVDGRRAGVTDEGGHAHQQPGDASGDREQPRLGHGARMPQGAAAPYVPEVMPPAPCRAAHVPAGAAA